MPEIKSIRNKTIDFPVHDAPQYLDRCLRLSAGQPCDFSTVKNQVIYGDSFQVLPLLPHSTVDLLIVDPPYNLTKDYHGTRFSRTDIESYRAYTTQWITALLPLLKPTASVYVCCDWRISPVIGTVLGEHLNVRNRITWQREKGRGALANWKNGMEDIWFATASDDYTFNLDAVKTRKKVIAPYRVDGKPKDWEETVDGNFRDTCPSNFWDDISIPYWSMPENTAHPTQKPEKLLAKLILASSNQGDVVFDPFLGSGTTAVVARKLGRDFIGIEQNPLYCSWAQKRLEMASYDTSIQGFSDGVFWERNTLSSQKRTPKSQELLFLEAAV